MNIGLRVSSSPKNTIGKTLSNPTIYTITLRDETNIMHPVVLINADLEELTGFNYATIGKFKRNFFIDSMESVRTGLVRIYLSVDVLESWKDQILANKALIKRQAKEYNKWINDGSMRAYANRVVSAKKFERGFTMNTNPSFVLTVAGGGVIS